MFLSSLRSFQREQQMEGMMGLLKVRVIKGSRMAIRDLQHSDPYVVVRLGKQKVKTRVIKKNLNPIWDEELSLYIPENALSLKLEVFDHDTFSRDDKMGDLVIDLQPLSLAVRKAHDTKSISNNNPQLCTIKPSKDNYLVKDSTIRYSDGNMVQDLCLKLQHVECGELELQLTWVDHTDG